MKQKNSYLIRERFIKERFCTSLRMRIENQINLKIKSNEKR